MATSLDLLMGGCKPVQASPPLGPIVRNVTQEELGELEDRMRGEVVRRLEDLKAKLRKKRKRLVAHFRQSNDNRRAELGELQQDVAELRSQLNAATSRYEQLAAQHIAFKSEQLARIRSRLSFLLLVCLSLTGAVTTLLILYLRK